MSRSSSLGECDMKRERRRTAAGLSLFQMSNSRFAVIASEAKQSMAFARPRSLLAMTRRHDFAFPRQEKRPGDASFVSLDKSEGAGSTGCTSRTRGTHAKEKRHRYAETSALPAQWLYGLYALSPVSGLVSHRRFSRNVTREA
jgi:hypothetical protein